MTYKAIKLRRGKEESLKRFHPWVFSGAIDSYDETIEEGFSTHLECDVPV